jgi:hypothetical protein
LQAVARILPEFLAMAKDIYGQLWIKNAIFRGENELGDIHRNPWKCIFSDF